MDEIAIFLLIFGRNSTEIAIHFCTSGRGAEFRICIRISYLLLSPTILDGSIQDFESINSQSLTHKLHFIRDISVSASVECVVGPSIV